MRLKDLIEVADEFRIKVERVSANRIDVWKTDDNIGSFATVQEACDEVRSLIREIDVPIGKARMLDRRIEPSIIPMVNSQDKLLHFAVMLKQGLGNEYCLCLCRYADSAQIIIDAINKVAQ